MMEDLQDFISRSLAEYAEDVKQTVNEAAKNVGKETVKELKKTSPKLTGNYKKGWTKKIQNKGRGIKKVIVYNKNAPHLTHLLEHGHAKRNGGRVAAKVHIEPAEIKAADNFEQTVREELSR